MSNCICCIECKFFAPGEFGMSHVEITEEFFDEITLDQDGQCRINPPVYSEEQKTTHVRIPKIYGVYPRVIGDDWCGKFEQKIFEETA